MRKNGKQTKVELRAEIERLKKKLARAEEAVYFHKNDRVISELESENRYKSIEKLTSDLTKEQQARLALDDLYQQLMMKMNEVEAAAFRAIKICMLEEKCHPDGSPVSKVLKLVVAHLCSCHSIS